MNIIPMILSFILLLAGMQMPQDNRHGTDLPFRSIAGGRDTLYHALLPEVTVYGKTGNTRHCERYHKRMDRLEYHVRKVYPYAKIAAEEIAKVEDKLAALPQNKEQNKYINQEYKALFKKFKKPLMALTVTQGKILVRLIDRETRKNAFSQIKNFKGGLSAVFWQSIALIFGNNLKAEYDPYGKDFQIEQIVRQIEKEHHLNPH